MADEDDVVEVCPEEESRITNVRQLPLRGDGYIPADTLPPSQRMFIAEYIIEMSKGAQMDPGQAAIRAGYSPRTAVKQASYMLRLPQIRAAIEKEMERIAKRARVTQERILDNVVEIGERCMTAEPVLDKKGNPTGEWRFDSQGALRAQELLGKWLEMWTDKVKSSNEVKVSVLVKADTMGKLPKK